MLAWTFLTLWLPTFLAHTFPEPTSPADTKITWPFNGATETHSAIKVDFSILLAVLECVICLGRTHLYEAYRAELSFPIPQHPYELF